MKTIKGPAIFLAQFADDVAPFNSLDSICKWASELGYKGVQIPTWEKKFIDLDKAAESKDYCDELMGIVAKYGMQISELSTHLQGQLVAVHKAYDIGFDAFAPKELHGKPKERTEWAKGQVRKAIKASNHMGLNAHATFSGAFIWHTFYPWPQRPKGLVEESFRELAARWTPILDFADENGVDVCYEIHPGEDLHDGISWERFVKATNEHPRANILYDPSHFIFQQLDYVQFIDFYHQYIKMFHVKDAEFNPDGRGGVYGGYADWIDRPARFRSPGDGQVDFGAIFSQLTRYGFDGWAVMEWECCIKDPVQGAREGAPFIDSHIIQATKKTFDDFAGGDEDIDTLHKIMGIE